MNRRLLACALFVAFAAASAHSQKLTLSPQPPGAPADLASRGKTASDLLDEVWQDHLRHSPVFATLIGDKQYNTRLPDYSVAAYNQQLARDSQYLTRLASIDTTGMSAQQVLSIHLMVNQLIAAQEASQYKPWEMPVTQVSGLPASLPRLVGRLHFTSAQDYDDYAARLSKVPAAFRQLTDNMMTGVQDQRVPPKIIVQELLTRVNAILAVKPPASVFARPLQEFPASISSADQAGLRAEVMKAITTQVYPAYQQFAQFLKGVYLPAGRAQPGAWSLPGGDAYYDFLVRQSTTAGFTPAQIHQMGEAWVARDEAAELAMAKKLGYPGVAALRSAMAADSRLHPASADLLLNAYRSDLAGMHPRLGSMFTVVPSAPLTVTAIPAWRAAEAPAAYYQADPSGGTLWVNTSDLAHRSLANVEVRAYQYGEPGEHLQVWLAREEPGLPVFRRYLKSPAFTQGWALYADQLGKDTGLFNDPYSEVGRLENDELQAIALVVDTGIHADRWTRQQAIDYYQAHSGLSGAAIDAEVDRIIAQPAQALACKTGELQILGLRAAAEKTLGAKFNLRSFDDQIVDAGPMPMDMLSNRVVDWMNGQLTGR